MGRRETQTNLGVIKRVVAKESHINTHGELLVDDRYNTRLGVVYNAHCCQLVEPTQHILIAKVDSHSSTLEVISSLA